MSASAHATVDVRDMLCAQALAVVARAAQTLAEGATLRVELNADDVRADLVAWAGPQGLGIVRESPTVLRLIRGRAR